jgi:hypothetical protein
MSARHALMVLAVGALACDPPEHCEDVIADDVTTEEKCVAGECFTDDDCDGGRECADSICWDGDECERSIETRVACEGRSIRRCERGTVTSTQECEFGCGLDGRGSAGIVCCPETGCS